MQIYIWVKSIIIQIIYYHFFLPRRCKVSPVTLSTRASVSPKKYKFIKKDLGLKGVTGYVRWLNLVRSVLKSVHTVFEQGIGWNYSSTVYTLIYQLIAVQCLGSISFWRGSGIRLEQMDLQVLNNEHFFKIYLLTFLNFFGNFLCWNFMNHSEIGHFLLIPF